MQYAEYGPAGKFDGRILDRYAAGDTGDHLHERGKVKLDACVFADSRCMYKRVVCAPDDPRLLALIAHVAPVEVRPAARAPHPPLRPRFFHERVDLTGGPGRTAAGGRRAC
jgi:hypothetical protein